MSLSSILNNFWKYFPGKMERWKLMSNKTNIFLLTPHDDFDNLPRVLIWADTEETARTNALTQLTPVHLPGMPVEILQNNPYEENARSDCRMLIVGEDYRVIDSEGRYRKIIFNKKEYTLTKNHPNEL